MGYDEAYYRTPNYFGADPEPILRNHHHRIGKSDPVLDIGAGQGRNTFFLAREGFVVDAVDPSEVAIQTISTTLVREALPIRTHCCGFETLTPQADSYSGILIFGLIPELPWDAIELLVDRCQRWTQRGSFVFVTAFTTEDPSLPRHVGESTPVGKNSFRDENGDVKTFLEPGELLHLFGGWKTLHHWEGMGPEHRHGNGPLERHGKAEAVLRRPPGGSGDRMEARAERALKASI